MIDSHCHTGIGAEALKGEALAQAFERAKIAGVMRFLTVGCDYPDVADLREMQRFAFVDGAFGIHPENADRYDEQSVRAVFESLPALRAVGEIGLDYYYNPDSRAAQLAAFEAQIELAHTLQLPVIIHSRSADEDMKAVLKNAFDSHLLTDFGVLHCFTGTPEMASFALEIGFYLSASGIITFKKASDLREIFQRVPEDRLLIETDAPYLAPEPYRGRVNEPMYLVETAKRLADLRGVRVEEIDRLTTANYRRLFLKEEGTCK